MELFPAIDLRGGRVVQLVQGDFSRERDHGDDPVAVARSFVEAGATWIHTVDLDAARTGEPANRELIAAIAAAVPVPVQAGGGVRTVAAARALAEAGVARVVMGTAALEGDGPELLATVAAEQRVAIGLDVKGREVVVRGWADRSGIDWADALVTLEGAGAEAVVVTQVQVEGLMGGPDLEGLGQVLAATELQVVASGGVGALPDLVALARVTGGGRRLAGAIVGTAIYEGRLDVGDAVRALAEVDDR